MVQDARVPTAFAAHCSARDTRRRHQLTTASFRHVSGLLTEYSACAQPDPEPMTDFANSSPVDIGVSPEIERMAEALDLPADVERWRWIVLGLGWGW